MEYRRGQKVRHASQKGIFVIDEFVVTVDQIGQRFFADIQVHLKPDTTNATTGIDNPVEIRKIRPYEDISNVRGDVRRIA